jgi:tetratricopeptide (TPR) repeat protein
LCRRPAAAALAAVGAAAVLILAAGGWWHAAALQVAAQREQRQRQAAERNFHLALEAIDRMLTDVAAVDLEDVPQMEPVREKVLEESVAFLEQFVRERGQDPGVRTEAARAHSQLGNLLALLGRQQEAEQHYREALALLGPQGQAAAGDVGRPELARARAGLGVLLKERKHFGEAQDELTRAIRLWEELAGERPDDAHLQEQLAAGHY